MRGESGSNGRREKEVRVRKISVRLQVEVGKGTDTK